MSFSQLPSARYRITGPGRVNLLGEHVDYNEGFVLPAAIDRVVKIAANPRNDDLVRLNARDMNSIGGLRLSDLDAKPTWMAAACGLGDLPAGVLGFADTDTVRDCGAFL